MCFVLRKWFRATQSCDAAFAQERFGCCAACSAPPTEAYDLMLTGKGCADVYKPKIGQEYRIDDTGKECRTRSSVLDQDRYVTIRAGELALFAFFTQQP